MKNSNTPATVYDNCFSDFITKLTAKPRHSVLDFCHKTGYIDTEDREVTIYYRTLLVAENAQTDREMMSYQVEQVLYNGEKLPIDSDYELELCQHLYLINPLSI